MGLFDFFKKKSKNKETVNTDAEKNLAEDMPTPRGEEIQSPNLIDEVAAHIEKEKPKEASLAGRNLLEDLVSYMQSKPEIDTAYFGMLYNKESKQNKLFLGVEHNGELESIKKMTYSIKQIYHKNTRMHFASTEERPDLLKGIKQFNTPFYSKKNQHKNELQVKLMQHYFNPNKYKPALIETLKKSKLISITQFVDGQNKRPFLTYNKGEQKFIPIFTSQEMVKKSALPKPENVVIVALEFKEEHAFDNLFFILNPGTPFEVEIGKKVV